MSLEQAILDHAAAIRELAAAFIQSQKNSAAGLEALQLAYETASGGAPLTTVPSDSAPADAELEQAVQKVEADAKKPNAESKAAIKEATKIAQARQEKSDAGSATQTQSADTAGSAKASDTTDQAAVLDYAKDVQPAALAFIKAKGKPDFVKLLGEFGVSTATQLKPEQYADFVARLAA